MATSVLRETKNETKKKTKSEAPTKALKLVAAVLFLLAGAAGGYWLGRAGIRFPGSSLVHASSKPHAEGSGGAVLQEIALDPFLVNLSGGRGYLKLAMTLDISGDSAARSSNVTQSLARSALVRDAILQMLSDQNADALLTGEGRDALKQTLMAALKKAAPSLPLEEIYFTEFLVQR
jgi:flagellar basal body-associated protein FliL